MSERTVDTIVFDVGNVLCRWDWQGYVKSFGFDEETYDHVVKATFMSPLWDEHDQGLCSDEEYLEQFIANDPAYEEEIRRVYAHDGDSVFLHEYAVEWVRSLKEKGYHLYILSNYSHNTFVQSRDRMEFLPYMDGYIFSYQVKQKKPHPSIFQTLFQRYDLEPSRCVFIDDLPANVEAAKALGMKGIVFTGYDQAVKDLAVLTVHR